MIPKIKIGSIYDVGGARVVVVEVQKARKRGNLPQTVKLRLFGEYTTYETNGVDFRRDATRATTVEHNWRRKHNELHSL